MTKEMTEFKDSLKSMSTEELTKLEAEIMEMAEATEKKIAETEFKLPKEGLANVCDGIRMLLEKHTVNWQYTLTLVELFEFWEKKNHKTINYHYLDNTLRILGSMQFTGYKEAKAVVDINKYFEPIKKDYIEAANSIYEVADKHSLVMAEMQLRLPVASAPEVTE